MTEPAREVRVNTDFGDETVFVDLNLPSLQLDIFCESGVRLQRMLGDDETLEKILDLALDAAVFHRDWAGLILLRECLLKWADNAQCVLKGIAKDEPRNKGYDE